MVMVNTPPPLDNMELTMPTPWQQTWYLAKRHLGLQVGFGIVLIAALAALFAPLLAPMDPFSQNLSDRLAPAFWQEGGGWQYILGTDAYGRDILSRLIYG